MYVAIAAFILIFGTLCVAAFAWNPASMSSIAPRGQRSAWHFYKAPVPCTSGSIADARLSDASFSVFRWAAASDMRRSKVPWGCFVLHCARKGRMKSKSKLLTVMCFALILSLLQIGAVEKHPGPMYNNLDELLGDFVASQSVPPTQQQFLYGEEGDRAVPLERECPLYLFLQVDLSNSQVPIPEAVYASELRAPHRECLKRPFEATDLRASVASGSLDGRETLERNPASAASGGPSGGTLLNGRTLTRAVDPGESGTSAGQVRSLGWEKELLLSYYSRELRRGTGHFFPSEVCLCLSLTGFICVHEFQGSAAAMERAVRALPPPSGRSAPVRHWGSLLSLVFNPSSSARLSAAQGHEAAWRRYEAFCLEQYPAFAASLDVVMAASAAAPGSSVVFPWPPSVECWVDFIDMMMMAGRKASATISAMNNYKRAVARMGIEAKRKLEAAQGRIVTYDVSLPQFVILLILLNFLHL